MTDIAFGANGYGCVCYEFSGTSALRWKVLDSRFNDTVYPHPKWLQAFASTADSRFLGLGRPAANYNKSKIYLSPPYGNPSNAILDCATQQLTLATQPVLGYFIMSRMSKTDQRIYIFGSFDQYIMNEAGVKGYSSTYSGSIGATSADFTYRPNEENFVYLHTENSGLLFLDYGNRIILNEQRTTSDTKQVEITTDGRMMIFRQSNAIVFLNTDWFYTYL